MRLFRRFDHDEVGQTPADIGYAGRPGLVVKVKEVTDLPGFTRSLAVDQVAGSACGITLFPDLTKEESGEALVLQRLDPQANDTNIAFVGPAVACGGQSETDFSLRSGLFREPLRKQIITYSSGTYSSTVATSSSQELDARNWHFLRVRFQFTKIQMRWWYPGEIEPSGWMLETTAATPVDIAPGKIGWVCTNRTGSELAYFGIAPIGAVETPPSLHNITGIITDANGQPCQRKVYAVTRPTDGTAPEVVAHGLSDPVSGEYTLDIPTTAEVSRVVVSEDDDSPLLNDLIDRIIPE